MTQTLKTFRKRERPSRVSREGSLTRSKDEAPRGFALEMFRLPLENGRPRSKNAKEKTTEAYETGGRHFSHLAAFPVSSFSDEREEGRILRRMRANLLNDRISDGRK